MTRDEAEAFYRRDLEAMAVDRLSHDPAEADDSETDACSARASAGSRTGIRGVLFTFGVVAGVVAFGVFVRELLGMLRVTVALISCAWCCRLLRIALWPWSGALVTRSHGICLRCWDEMERDDAREGGVITVDLDAPDALDQLRRGLAACGDVLSPAESDGTKAMSGKASGGALSAGARIGAPCRERVRRDERWLYDTRDDGLATVRGVVLLALVWAAIGVVATACGAIAGG